MPLPQPNKPALLCPAQMELRSFSRSIGELQWLLLALVLLYSQAPGTKIADPAALIWLMVAFGLFVLGFRFLNFFAKAKRWKLAIETWAMILFVSLAAWETGGTSSPLIGAYLLILIASALTLGKHLTLLETLLITTIYLYMAYATHGLAVFSLSMFSELMVRFTPLLLVAYLTTMLASDIHYAKQLLAEQSDRDELTGLLNMRGFNRVLALEVNRVQRYGHPLALLMIDADNLKAINDGHGHEAGNRLIRLVAETVYSGLRASDTLARYGGDEFIVLLPDTDRERTAAVAERIRVAVANSSTNFNGARLEATVSIGAAVTDQSLTDQDELQQAADRALYASKKAGRNRVTIHGA